MEDLSEGEGDEGGVGAEAGDDDAVSASMALDQLEEVNYDDLSTVALLTRSARYVRVMQVRSPRPPLRHSPPSPPAAAASPPRRGR